MNLLTREVPANLAADGRGRVRQAVVASERPVEVWDARRGAIVLEILMLDGLRVAERVPLLADHTSQVRSTIGTATDFRPKGLDLRAQLRFAAGTVASEESWALVEGGHLRGLSVGYRVLEAEEIAPGQSRTIRGRQFTAPPDRPLRVAAVWALKEVSLVPIPADESAVIRSSQENLFSRRNRPMSTTTRDYIPERTRAESARALEAMRTELSRNEMIRWPALLAAGMRALGVEVPDGDYGVLRDAPSLPGLSDAITTLATVRVQNAFEFAPDSLAGIRTVVDLANFRQAQALVADAAGRLEALPRGGTAADLWLSIHAETIRLGRYAGRIEIDEQDIIDQAENVNAQLLAGDEAGRAAKRLVLDLGWGLLLSNPTLAADSKAVFHTDHANLLTGGASALSTTSLASALAAIQNQTMPDDEGDPVHLNIPGRHLRVTPALVEPARRLARDIALGDGQDLTVVGESRLSATGFIDPASESEVTGSATCWMLAADGAMAPSLLVGALGGRLEPKIRSGVLSGGQWGWWLDVVLDVGVAIADYRPLVWSAGA